MAVTLTLSPWPTGSAGITAATEYLAKQTAGRISDSDTLCQLGALAAALIEREAPGAPQAVKNECAVRVVGYLSQADYGAFRSETIGPVERDYTADHSRAFRRCGAKGFLAPWKLRNAGSIGGVPAPAPAAPEFVNPPVMRFAFSDALPFTDDDFRWYGTINNVEIDSQWTQPAAFGFWIAGPLSVVAAFVQLILPPGSVTLADFGPAQPYRFGNTDGFLRATPLTFTGVFNQPNAFRAVLADA